MADPVKYTQNYDFSDFAEDNPSSPLPGDRVDIELAEIETSISDIVEAIKSVRRSDGRLKNNSVGPDQLSAALSIGFTMAGTWAEGTVYGAGDGVTKGTTFYKARVANTATTLNAPDVDSATWMSLFTMEALAVADGSITPAKLDATAVADFRALLEVGPEGIAAASSKAVPVNADLFGLVDTEASNVLKKITWGNIKTENFATLGALIAAATAKATPVDADLLLLADSAASNASKKLTIASLKTWVGVALGPLVAAATGKSSPIDGDTFLMADSAASSATKKITFAELKAIISAVGVTELYIPATAFTPQITNGAAAGIVELSTNLQPLETLDFDTSTQEFACVLIPLPKRWNLGTITAQFYWTAASGSGGVAWAAQGVAVSDDDVLNAAYGTEQVATDTFIAANDLHITGQTAAITIAGTPAVADGVWLRVKRVPANASDTLAADAKLIGVKVRYTTNQGNDA
jgi:hypothetical protein